MAIYGATSILSGVTGSIKEINPSDAAGDGNGVVLVEGDFFIVFHESNLYFYKVMIGTGQTENGTLLLISNIASNVYFVRVGITKNTIEGSVVGDEFYISTGSDIPPSGFSREVVPYSKKCYTYWDKPALDNDLSWYGTAYYDRHLFVRDDSQIINVDVNTGEYTTTPLLTPNGESYYQAPGHCIESEGDGSEKYLTDIEKELSLSRFNLDTELDEPIPYVMPVGETWTTIFGQATPPSSNGLRIGKWHYLFGGWGSKILGGVKANILTGEVLRIANSPNTGCEAGANIPDFITGDIYHINRNSLEFYRLNNATNTWSVLSSFGLSGLGGADIAWKDDDTNTIAVCITPKKVGIYDITLNVWEYFNNSEFDGDAAWSSYCLWYKNLGALWPWGYGTGTADRFHGIIPSKNPVKIIKE